MKSPTAGDSGDASPESIEAKSLLQCAGINRHEAENAESYEKGVAIRSAPSFALYTARCTAKRKQGYRWAGY